VEEARQAVQFFLWAFQLVPHHVDVVEGVDVYEDLSVAATFKCDLEYSSLQ
jgi:hypothetical protein